MVLLDPKSAIRVPLSWEKALLHKQDSPHGGLGLAERYIVGSLESNPSGYLE